jgi:hypothetical protein
LLLQIHNTAIDKDGLYVIVSVLIMEKPILELPVLVAIAKTIVVDGKMVAALAEIAIISVVMVIEIEEEDDDQATV